MDDTTRWSPTLSLKVNLNHAITLRAFCGANLGTYPAEFRAVETLELHRVKHATNPKIARTYQDRHSPPRHKPRPSEGATPQNF